MKTHKVIALILLQGISFSYIIAMNFPDFGSFQTLGLSLAWTMWQAILLLPLSDKEEVKNDPSKT